MQAMETKGHFFQISGKKCAKSNEDRKIWTRKSSKLCLGKVNKHEKNYLNVQDYDEDFCGDLESGHPFSEFTDFLGVLLFLSALYY